jgi:hypothetical protein
MNLFLVYKLYFTIYPNHSTSILYLFQDKKIFMEYAYLSM